MNEHLSNLPDGFLERKLLDVFDLDVKFDIEEGKLLRLEDSVENILNSAKLKKCFTFGVHRDGDSFGMTLIRQGNGLPIVLRTRQEANNEKSVWIERQDLDRLNQLLLGG